MQPLPSSLRSSSIPFTHHIHVKHSPSHVIAIPTHKRLHKSGRLFCTFFIVWILYNTTLYVAALGAVHPHVQHSDFVPSTSSFKLWYPCSTSSSNSNNSCETANAPILLVTDRSSNQLRLLGLASYWIFQVVNSCYISSVC